jgi:hypothetical protein
METIDPKDELAYENPRVLLLSYATKTYFEVFLLIVPILLLVILVVMIILINNVKHTLNNIINDLIGPSLVFSGIHLTKDFIKSGKQVFPQIYGSLSEYLRDHLAVKSYISERDMVNFTKSLSYSSPLYDVTHNLTISVNSKNDSFITFKGCLNDFKSGGFEPDTRLKIRNKINELLDTTFVETIDSKLKRIPDSAEFITEGIERFLNTKIIHEALMEHSNILNKLAN